MGESTLGLIIKKVVHINTVFLNMSNKNNQQLV